MADTNTRQQVEPGSGIVATELDGLLKREFKPKSDQAKQAVERAVHTLAEQALADTAIIGSDVIESIKAIIARLDQKLSDQINEILHHDDFQKLEGAWRGLHYLVNNTETDEMLKIRVKGTIQEPEVSAQSMGTFWTTVDEVLNGGKAADDKKRYK